MNEIIQTDNNVPSIINKAIASGSDLSKLEKLLELQERWERNEAKKSYHKAMTLFKANPPLIDKDQQVSYGNTKYKHASLANVTSKINAELSKHGLSASWMIDQHVQGLITVVCRITHEQGYSEETGLSAPSDQSGSKNAIQAIGSTITYLERYTILALTGLSTSDDDDGRASGTEIISTEEANMIMDHLMEIEAPIDKFLEYMGLNKLESMPKSMMKKAMAAIEISRSKKAVKR